MNKREFHNTIKNTIKTVFKAPNRNLQAFVSGRISIKILFVLTLLTSLTVWSINPVESKRLDTIDFGVEQVVNIFPTEVETVDWAGVEEVLIQDLTDDALYGDFSARNSAYVPQESPIIPVDKNTSPTLPSVAKPSTDVSEFSDVPSTNNDSVQEPVVDETQAPSLEEGTVEEVVNVEVVDDTEPAAVEAELLQTTEEVIEDPVIETAPAVEEEPVPVEPEPEVSLLDSARSYVENVFAKAYGLFPLAQESIITPIGSLQTEPEPVVEEIIDEVGIEVLDVPVEEALTESVATEVVPEVSEVSEVDAVEVIDVVADPLFETNEQEVPVEDAVVIPVLDTAVDSDVVPAETQLIDGTDPDITTDTEIDGVEKMVHEITLKNFETAPLEKGQFVTGMQLRLSFAAQLETPASGTVPYVEVMFGKKDSLEVVGMILLDDEVSNAINGGYYLFALPALNNINQLNDVQVVLRYHGESDILDGMFLDAAWVEVDTKIITKEDLEQRGVAKNLKELKAPELNTLITDKINFERDESPIFNLRYTSQRNALVRGVRNFIGRDLVKVSEVNVRHRTFGLLGLKPDINVTTDGLISIEIPQDQLSKMRPGTYEIELLLNEGGVEYTDTFNFQWGVLSINPNKSEYEAGETAFISIGALTPNGNTVCHANLDLYITDPVGAISKIPVSESGLCDGNNVIDVPDFSAIASTTEPGIHGMYLERLDDDGNVLSFTNDTFLVTPSQKLSIERDGPTRIYPPATYPMTLTVATDQSFEGVLTERVPSDFVITDTKADISVSGSWQILTWDISIMGAGTESVSYTFDAPDISPYLYSIGPASLQENSRVEVVADPIDPTLTQETVVGGALFSEHRKWQIASDAVGNMILFWDDGATIPAGWTCLSCTATGTFYQRFAMGSSTYNSTGGATTHTHTANGSVFASGLGATDAKAGTTIANTGHTHTLTPTIGTASNLPAYRQLRVIQYTTAAGEPTTIPAGAIGIFDVASSSLPSGWNRYGAQDGKYVYGENTPGTTAGSNTHVHSITGTTGAAAAGTQGNTGPDAADGAAAGHTHTINASTTVNSNEPPYIEVLLGQLTSDATPPNGLIAMWTEDVDDTWLNISSSPSDPFSNRFIKASATYGSTGGGSSHTESNVTGITSSVPSAIVTTAKSGSAGSDSTHTHSVSVTGFSTDSNLPPYLTVVYGKRQGTDPVYDQTSSKWYVNLASQTPTEPWPDDGGVIDLVEREPITATSTPVKNGDTVRLRINVGVSNATSTAGAAFKLQYAAADTCSSASGWLDVGDISSTTIWRGYDNSGVSDESTLSTTLLASSTVSETYEEDGYASTTPNDINVGDYGEWDFVLQQNGAVAGTNYCFRMVEADGTAFATYSHYPRLFTNEAPTAPTLQKPFDNEKTLSSAPWFYFVTTDPEGEKIHYEIEIDNNYDFGSAEANYSTANEADAAYFENQVLTSDKAPFQHGEQIRFTQPSSLATSTYYWHVRAQDPEGSGEWGEWSEIRSFTIDTTLDASAWFQTQNEQFDSNALSGVETGSGQASLISGSSTGTMISTSINFTDGDYGTAWDSFVFSDTEGTGDIKYKIEYLDGTDTWTLIPDSYIPNNSVGIDNGSPISLLSLDTDTYSTIRIVANYANPGTPSVQDWAIYWGYRVETPTIAKLFPNEQTGTTTPILQFTTTDPQDNDLTYEVQWSLTPDFTSSTTRNSSTTPAGFVNIDNGGDTDPFYSGDNIQYTIQTSDALIGTTTYWWRVRAKDSGVGGDNAWSFWTDPQSFTVIPGTEVSTWFQTTQEQFDSNILSGTIALATDAVSVATTATEAMLVYGEGTEYVPRYRQWNGSSWSTEGNMIGVDAPVKWAVVKAATTREEYVAVTVGTDADVNAQVFSTGEWGNLQEMTVNVGSVSARGVDVAYEALSGNALVAYCDATTGEAAYYIWNGSSWATNGTITLASANPCAWIKLASDPVSNEIILMVRDSVGTAAASYEVWVWNGSTWANSSTQGGSRSSSYETMALNYETSGGQALSVSGDGTPVRFEYNSWNGTAWAGLTTNSTISDNLIWAELSTDPSSDAMVMCYVDESVNIGSIQWTGSAWTGQTDLSAVGNSVNDRAVSCSYDLSSNIIAAYSTTTGAAYQVWNGATWSGEGTIVGITDSATVQTARTGEGKILALFFDDVNDRLDFSSWNGSWSSAETLETNMSVDTSPYGEPFMMAPRNSGSEGTTIVSPGVDFNDGTGPYWKTFSWNDSQPGTSQILYHLQYQTATGSWAFIPDVDLPGNVSGTTTGPYDLSNLNTNTYNVIRPYAELSCDGSGNCPSVNDWKIEWAGGITISGTAQLYDQSTNATSGVVAVAVNGVLQSGKTGTISAGTWSIGNVTTFPGDIVTVFITGAVDSKEAVAVARYGGQGDIDGVVLYERHLTLGSNDATTTPFTNAEIGQYDFTNTEDIFFDLNGTSLNMCADTGCSDVEIYIKSGEYYSPGGRVVTHDVENNGTFTAGSYIHEVNGSWDNNGTTTMTGSTIVFAATSTTESIDSTGAVTSSFNNVTFGTTTGSGTWTLPSTLDVNGNLNVTRGTLARGTTSITIAGNLTTGSNGLWTGIGTTTFDGGVGKTWNDEHVTQATKQNIGNVLVDGTSKIVTLAGDVAAESITIGSNDTLDASALGYDIIVYGSWLNQNNFIPRTGEVFFAATTTNKNITTAGDAFYDLSFIGVGGSWSFTEATLLVNNDFTVSTGTVTLPSNGTTTIAGSFDATGGTFAHNNGTLYFTSTAAESITFDGEFFINVANNLVFNGGGSWTITDTNATSSNDIRISQGTVNFPSGVLAIGGTLVNSAGTFVGGTGTTLFYSSNSELITTGGSSFGNVEFNGTGDWSFSDTNVTAGGDLLVDLGTLVMPNGIFTIGGSYSNNDTVTAGTGSVLFNSTSAGETIDFGASTLNNVTFNTNSGEFTFIAPATTTSNFILTDVANFDAGGQLLSIGGIFTNSVGGASTTWAGSTLSLEAGSYSINTKTDSGDAYETLRIAANTDIAMWNSVATTYVVDSTGSLYSKDHNAVDGDLYIFGDYVNNDGSEYWSYATDFDGVDLSGGSERQVDVRFAAGASATFGTSSVEILGNSVGSTTIANQGAGTYTVTVVGGTTTAQYYEFSDLGSTGVSLLGGTLVPKLRDGSYVVGVAAGTALTLSSTTIDANPGKQIYNIDFATTTAIAANNVTQTDGAPASFWWFREGHGNLYGENYDNDTGDPGSVRFDDSSLVITISGTVYDNTLSPITGGTCDGVVPVVRVMVDTVEKAKVSCSAADGSYSAPGVVVIGDPTITVYLDNASGGEKGNVITRTPTADILDMDIYADRVIVRNEDAEALTIANLATYDSSDDTDLQFLAATTSSPDTLTIFAGNELFVFATSTFTPGGVVTLEANAAANSYDGTLYINNGAVFNAYGTSTLTIGGRLVLAAGASFDAATTTVLMNATTTGKSITSPSEITFYDLVFNGTGGGWNLGADIRIENNMTITAGTVTGTGDIYLESGSLTGNGILSLGAGTTTLAATNTLGGTSEWTFYNLELGDTFQVGTTTPVFVGTTTVSGVLTINSAHYLDAGSTVWDLAGAGTVFVEDGTFLEDTSKIRYSGPGATVLSTQYYDLDLNSGAGSQTYVAGSIGMIVDGDLTVGGDAASVFDLTSADPLIDVNGNVVIRNNGTISASDTNDFTIAGSYDNNGTFIGNGGLLTFDGAGTIDIAAGDSSFSNVLVNVTGDVTISEYATTTTAFSLTNANTFTLSSGQSLAVGGTFFNAIDGANTTWTNTTLRLYGGNNYSINAATTSDNYSTLDINDTTQIRMWNSDATVYDVSPTASLYSQDHNDIAGDLYIWGDYRRTSGSDHWSYATDFDGTALGGSSRKVDVYIATSSSVTVTGGSLGVYGVSNASTTIQNQGSGSYSLLIGGSASSSFRYYEIRDIDSDGLVITGNPDIGTLSNGDIEVSQNGGTAMTVGGAVITNNPALTSYYNRFALNGVATGFNVTATGTSDSSWRFENHYGGRDGEDYDVDPSPPIGDPGYLVWDDSTSTISIRGKVYSDEGSTVSNVCTGANVISLYVNGALADTVGCDGTGQFVVSDISYSSGQSIIAYIDNGGSDIGATVSADLVSDVNNFNIYEDRVIVRHEGVNPLSISDMSIWDSSDDPDIPFTATTDLTLPSDTKLIVWNNKEFEPGGDVIVSGGGAGAAYDGTLELFAGATWTGQNTEDITIGGSFVLGSGSAFVSSNGTTTFTSTVAGRTITVNSGDFYNIAFTGSGSWTVTDPILTVGGYYYQSAGSVTLPSGTTTITGSFINSGGTFDANEGVLVLDGSGSNTVTFGGSDAAEMRIDGNYVFGDTNATTTGTTTIISGDLTLPSGVFTVGGDFRNIGGSFTHNTSELILTNATVATVLASSSDLYAVTFRGGGTYAFEDHSLSLLDNLFIEGGNVTFASGTMSIGGSFDGSGGTFDNATGTILFNSSSGGEFIDAGTSDFYNVQISAPTGGYTLLSGATTTNNFSLASINSFTVQSGTVLTVNGVFLNSVDGSNTTWSGSTLKLDGNNAYAVNTKLNSGDQYDTLVVGPDSDIRFWNSAATTTIVDNSSSVYSQDHSGTNGSLYIFGDLHIGTTTEYWSYATDFDGTSLAGSERVVTVSHATSATTTVDGGSLQVVGASGSETTITNQGSGTYALAVSAGTFNAQYYKVRNINSDGLDLSGTPVISSLSYGDYELVVNGGSLITISSSTLNANASKVIIGARFATTTAITGYNVTLTGVTSNAWTFTSHTGNLDGEDFDVDGATACGSIRWNDSSCLLTQQTDYRWRNDDGGLGVPNSEWYDSNWSARKYVRVENNDAVTYTDAAVQMFVAYDPDMQADFDDLRFTSSNGTTIVPHWVGSSTNSSVAEVWVKIPSLAAEDITDIYMYYNNPSATTTSSSTQVFVAADDFEDGDLSEYSGETVDFTVDGTFAYGGSYGLDATGNETGRTESGGAYTLGQTVSVGETIRYMQYLDTSGGSTDEVCTKFGIQSSGAPSSNYAVCTDLNGTDRIVLVRNAVDNAGTSPAVTLDSSNISVTTGWYTFEIDWSAGGIDVSMYNEAGGLIATASSTDTNYTSGGFGYSFWFQHGGWDNFTSRPTLETEPTVLFGAEQTSGGASWKAAQNSPAIYNLSDIARLRLVIENTGLPISNQQFLLEYAPLSSSPSCESVNPNNYVSVPVQASCGTSPVCMQSSSFVTNGAATFDLLTGTNGVFTAGEARENPSNITGNINVDQDEYTELEFVVTPTSNVVDESLCFRVTNNGTEYDTYLSVAQMDLRFDPVLTNINLNNGLDISLLPGTTTPVYATSTVSDYNGFTDIVSATSTIYRSGVTGGAACTPNNNDCYVSSCSFTNCSGDTCTIECLADIYFHADPTSTSTPYEGQEWLAFIEVEDSSAGYDFGSSIGVEMNALRAISIDGVIDYGIREANTDTGSYNASTSILNEGNVEVDIEIQGTDLSDGVSSVIPANEQKFATSSFTYSSCGATCEQLSSTTPVTINVDLIKPTTDAPPVSDDVYWGIFIPIGINSAPHQGVNVFTPISP